MAAKKETKTKDAPAKAKKAEEPKFTKAHILTMKRYVERRDLLSVLLDDAGQYTHDEVEAIINDFMSK